MLVRRLVLVEVPVEEGVVQAGAQHPLVAGGHPVEVLAAAVADGQEAGQQPRAVRALHGEVSLVRLEGGDDDLRGQLEVRLGERPPQHRRMLAEVDDLLQQLRVLAPARGRA